MTTWGPGSEVRLAPVEMRSVDGRGEETLGAAVLSPAVTGGDVSGVMDCPLARPTAPSTAALSVERPSREWVTAGVKGGDWTAETGGEA